MTPFEEWRASTNLTYWNLRMENRLNMWPHRRRQDLTRYMPSLQIVLRKLLLDTHDLAQFVTKVDNPNVNAYMGELETCLDRLARQISQAITALRCTYQRIHGHDTAGWTLIGYLWPESSGQIHLGLFNNLHNQIFYNDHMDQHHSVELVALISAAIETERLLSRLTQKGMRVRSDFMTNDLILGDNGYNDAWDADGEVGADDPETGSDSDDDDDQEVENR